MSLTIIAYATTQVKADAIGNLRERFASQNIILNLSIRDIDAVKAEVLEIKKRAVRGLYVIALDADELDVLSDLPLSNFGQGVILVSDDNNTQAMRNAKHLGALDYVPFESLDSELISVVDDVAKKAQSTSKVLGFTGMGGGAGSSTISAYFAQYCATTLGQNTALVDFDLAFGRQGVDFAAVPKSSFAADFIKSLSADTALDGLYSSVFPNLDVFSSPHVQNLVEIEQNADGGAFINVLRDRYDIVILDIPTALANFDAELLGYLDTLNLVFTSDLNGIRNLSNVLRWLDSVNVVSFHTILNKFTKKANIQVEDIRKIAKLSEISVFYDDPLIGRHQNRLDIDNRKNVFASDKNAKAIKHVSQINSLARTVAVGKSGFLGGVFNKFKKNGT